MAITINSTPGSPSANSYVSTSEMASYVSDRVVDTAAKAAWNALAADLQATYLVNATRQLDNMAEWVGLKYSADQALSWPRSDAWIDGYLLSSTIVPTSVKEATCEMALWLLGNSGEISQSQNAEFDSLKVGSIEINFNERVAGSKNRYFPDIVAYILSGYAVLQDPNVPSANRLRTVRLIRA